jgi:O-antigen ligase
VTEAPRQRDLALEIPLLVLAFSGVIFFAGVHRSFIAAHFIAAVLLLAFYFARAALTGKLRIAFPIFGVAPLAVLVFGWVQANRAISIAPTETSETLLRYGTATIVFFLAAFAARDDEARRRLGIGVAALVAFEVLYGIAEHFGGREYILFWPKSFPGSVAGTFNNRDHFAGVLVLATPFLLGLAQGEPWRWQGSAPRLSTRLALALDDPGFWKALGFFGAAFLGGLGVALSLSRGAALAFVVAVLVYAALVFRGRGRSSGLLVVGALVAVVGLGIALYGSTDPIMARFSQMSENARGEKSRVAFARGTLQLIAERPLTGSGLGTFERSFTHVQTAWYDRAYLEHAHCDLLQLPEEIGVPLAALSVALLGFSLLAASRRTATTASFGLIAGAAGGLAHALVDFTLQREGPLVFAAFLLGVLLGPRAPSLVLHGIRARVAGPFLALALAPLVPFPWIVLEAELLVNPTVRVEDDTRDPRDKIAAIESAIALRPEKADYRRLAVETRLDAYMRSIDEAAREAATNLAGEKPPDDLVASLRASIAATRVEEAALVQTRCTEDLRRAVAADPANARVLSLLALVTPDAAEARERGDEAVRQYPFGADVLVEAGIGRLKLDKNDARGEDLLKQGLALDSGYLTWAAFHATAYGLERELSRALPDVESRREWARRLLARGRLDLLGEELDALAATEERHVPEAPPAASGATLTRIRPDAWLDKPGGYALERLEAPVLRLGRRRACVELPVEGTLVLETSLVPLHRPVFLCVVFAGKHLGHVLVSGDWAVSRFLVRGSGWLEIEPALKRHAVADLVEADDGVLVRDVAIVK